MPVCAKEIGRDGDGEGEEELEGDVMRCDRRSGREDTHVHMRCEKTRNVCVEVRMKEKTKTKKRNIRRWIRKRE